MNNDGIQSGRFKGALFEQALHDAGCLMLGLPSNLVAKRKGPGTLFIVHDWIQCICCHVDFVPFTFLLFHCVEIANSISLYVDVHSAFRKQVAERNSEFKVLISNLFYQ